MILKQNFLAFWQLVSIKYVTPEDGLNIIFQPQVDRSINVDSLNNLIDLYTHSSKAKISSFLWCHYYCVLDPTVSFLCFPEEANSSENSAALHKFM